MNIKVNTTIENLSDTHNGQCYQGTVRFFGVYHHVRLIRVKDGNIIEPEDDAAELVKACFADMQRLYDGAYHVVTVPGLPGRYALCIFPFAD